VGGSGKRPPPLKKEKKGGGRLKEKVALLELTGSGGEVGQERTFLVEV